MRGCCVTSSAYQRALQEPSVETVQPLMGVCAQISAMIEPEDVFDIQGLFRIGGLVPKAMAKMIYDDVPDQGGP